MKIITFGGEWTNTSALAATPLVRDFMLADVTVSSPRETFSRNIQKTYDFCSIKLSQKDASTFD